MPPKRCQGKGRSIAIKKKKKLEKRLIQISLKLDGFVYKNKPISVYEAERYIQEISCYEKDCADDPRSLQVIEKLIRCMTGIIAEHKETFPNSSFTNVLSDHNYCQSPVYSLPDEDRSQIIVNIREASRNLREIETIDLCDDDDNNNELINNGISNLSIGDNILVQNTKSDCSQSILTNVKFNTFDNNKVLCDNTNVVINKSQIKIVPIGNLRETCSNEDNTKNQKEVIKSYKNINKTQIVTNNKDTEKENTLKNIRLNNSNKKNSTADTFLKTADNKIKRKRNKIIGNNNDVTQKIKAGFNKDKLKRRTRKSSSKFTLNKEADLENSVLKIYNKCTENDLSWIENIRYVREVRNDEFYTNLKVGTDFWDNIGMPGILDDNDFSYN